MRMFLRFLSAFTLSIAVVAGVLDTVQSFASSQVVLTSLLTAWSAINPSSLDAIELTVQGVDPALRLADALVWTLAQPAFAVFLVVALLFWMLGYKKPKPAGRFAA